MANNKFVVNQMNQQKPFMVTVVGSQPGVSTQAEIAILQSNRLYDALNFFTEKFPSFFQYIEESIP